MAPTDMKLDFNLVKTRPHLRLYGQGHKTSIFPDKLSISEQFTAGVVF